MAGARPDRLVSPVLTRYRQDMWWVLAGFVAMALAHTAPFPFLLEYMGPGRSIWQGPPSDGAPAVFLTYDDGPNPEATPALLDVLAREGVTATFFVIPDHVTEATATIVRRTIAEGHAVAMHSSARGLLLKTPTELAAWLEESAARIERLVGTRPCQVFRPHAGWRGGQMYEGLDRAGYRLAGWGFSMWDFNFWRAPKPEKLASRLAGRASDGSIVVMHDGDDKDPRAERRHTVEATAQLIPLLRARGFAFGTLCPLAP
jgi:peptidoglycan/xylan/chitin deacetylase (PgdA/CDA1 family)